MPTIRTVIAALGLLLAVAACGGGGAAASASAPSDADATISAQSNKFDVASISLPAGEATKVFFRNLEGVPHNVAIYTDASASDDIYVGEVVTNAAITYDVPALEAGEYFFRCDVHPDMKGTVVAGG